MDKIPTPALIYPAGGPIWLLSEIQRLMGFVHDLINICGQRDRRIADLEHGMAERDRRIADLESQVAAGVHLVPAEPAPDLQQAAD